MAAVSDRNRPCRCGSGKRFKHCCGALTDGPEADAAHIGNLMISALGHQQAGELAVAESLYRRALAAGPDNPDCLHMLGAICYMNQRNWEAFEFISRALDLTGWAHGMMRYNLGLVVAALAREAGDAFDAPPGGEGDPGKWSAVRHAAERLTALAWQSEQYRIDDSLEPLLVPEASAPSVSIVVPAYGQHAFTNSCVRSIVRHTEPGRYEIVVIDDASPEPVATALAHVTGLRVFRNEANLGFVGSCNRGAAVARGEFLVLLNSDTLVTEAWLQALLSPLADPKIGLVGAKLVYPDQTLQEAGCILWRGAIPAQWGRNDDPGKPDYNYLRDVDYCSGACLALRREEYLALGGFDSAFAPAYFEDADLAMRLRGAGRRVVYQPAATIVHFEGKTSGRDVREGVKQYQVANAQRFAERWRDSCATHAEMGSRPDLEKDRGRTARVLIVDAFIPVPDKDSGSVRMCEIMSLLVRAGCKVTFVAHSLEFVEASARRLQQAGIEVLHHPYAWSIAQVLAERGPDLDLVILCRCDVAASAIAAARRYAPQSLLAFDTVDLHFLREERQAALTRAAHLAEKAAATRRRELEVVRSADVTLVVSDAERALLADAAPGAPVRVLSNVHDVQGRRADFRSRRDIFFVGGFRHPPNVDAVVWYASQIWPLVRSQLPDVTTFVIGADMPASARELAGNGIEPVGFVPDLAPYLDGCRLSVAPLRFGAGVKGKISTAQSRGVPVVATSLAVEGMNMQDGRDVLVADDAADFAQAIVRLYADEALWTVISDGGMANVAAHFSREAAAQVLQELLDLARKKRAGAFALPATR